MAKKAKLLIAETYKKRFGVGTDDIVLVPAGAIGEVLEENHTCVRVFFPDYDYDMPGWWYTKEEIEFIK